MSVASKISKIFQFKHLPKSENKFTLYFRQKRRKLNFRKSQNLVTRVLLGCSVQTLKVPFLTLFPTKKKSVIYFSVNFARIFSHQFKGGRHCVESCIVCYLVANACFAKCLSCWEVGSFYETKLISRINIIIVVLISPEYIIKVHTNPHTKWVCSY